MLGIDPMYEYDNMRYETSREKFSIDFPIYTFNDILMLQDIFKFDENYKEKYYEEKCIEWNGIYDNLSVVDGLRWSDEAVQCGLYLKGKLENIDFLYNIYYYKVDIYGNIRKSQNGYSIMSKGDKIKFTLK